MVLGVHRKRVISWNRSITFWHCNINWNRKNPSISRKKGACLSRFMLADAAFTSSWRVIAVPQNIEPRLHEPSSKRRRETLLSSQQQAKGWRCEPCVSLHVGSVSKLVCSWKSEWVYEWVLSCNITPYWGIFILPGPVMHVPRTHGTTERSETSLQNTGADHAQHRLRHHEGQQGCRSIMAPGARLQLLC